MRKILTKIVTMLTVVILSVTAFAGCGLITTNTDRDMAQVVAKVQIADDINAEEIANREMASAFMSYGYNYVYYYGYTTSATYELILENLVKNRVIIQQARKELAKLYNGLLDGSVEADTEFLTYFKANAKANGTAINYANGDAETLEKYLTEYEVAQALYATRVSINDIIDSYETAEDEEEDEKEDETFTPRTTPTKTEEDVTDEYELVNETPSEYDYKVADVVLGKGVQVLKADYPTTYELNMAVYEAYEIDLSTSARKKAFTKALKVLKDNGLITSDESYDISNDANEALKYTYFKDSIKAQYETLVVSKYEDSLVSQVEAKLNGEAVWDQYLVEYKAQQNNYQNNISAYESALDAVNEDSFVVCNPYTGYGYVSNLLIGFTTEQSAQLTNYSSKAGITQADINAMRETLLKQLIVKDQRDSWVYSSYGEYSEESSQFTFDTDYFVSEEESAAYSLLKNYIGTVYGATSTTEENEDKVEETTWSFTNVIPTSLSFDSFMSTYVTALTGMNKLVFDKNNVANTVAQIDLTDEKRAAFDDLLYVFSTDPGSLGSYLGYTYSPFNADTTYVKEFAEATKEVVALGKGAYTIVATDYGYHLIVCTKKVEADEYDENSKEKFIADLANEDSLAYKYREVKLANVTSDEVGKIANNFINKYMEENVEYFKDAYSDLITEETETEA